MAIPRAARDTLNRLSLVLVMALSLVTIGFTGSQLGQHYGLRPPWETAAAMPPNTSGLFVDPQLSAEAGLGEGNVPEAPLPFDTPSALPGGLRLTASDYVWIPVMLYHYVRTAPVGDKLGYSLSVTPSDFAAQMQYLKDNGYTTLTLQQVDLVLEHRMAKPAKPIALTFDDGYSDFYTAAAPVLRSFGMTATEYIPTQLLGDSRGAYMTWDELQQLDAQGFEMAAHSQFHVDVSKQSAGRARTEIFGSKYDLESHLGHPVFDWAYPYGGYSAFTISLVQQAGFVSGATTNQGGWHDAAQLQRLTRIRVGGGESLSYWASFLAPR